MTVAMPPLLSGLGRALVQQDQLKEAEAERIAAEAKPESGGSDEGSTTHTSSGGGTFGGGSGGGF